VPVFERREVADEIDQQLLPIFWKRPIPGAGYQCATACLKAAPGEAAARDALRRNLHHQGKCAHGWRMRWAN